MIKTEFSFSQDEVRDFYKFHLTTKSNARLLYNLVALVAALAGIIILLIAEDGLYALILLAASIITLLIYPIQLNRMLKKMVISTYKRDKQQINFDENYIETIIEGESKKFHWEDIVEVNETSKYFYFYLGKKNALIVNKTTLSKENIIELVNLTKRKKGNITLYLKK